MKDGVPLTALVELQPGARVMQVISGRGTDRFLFAGANGYGFLTELDNLVARAHEVKGAVGENLRKSGTISLGQTVGQNQENVVYFQCSY